MVVHRIACWLLVMTMVVVAVSASTAQTGSQVRGRGSAKISTACGDDLQRFCAGVQPGGGRLVQCLSGHTGELSEACAGIIAGAGGGNKLRAACGDDLQRFCVGVQPGGGRLIQCLSNHTRELSVVCGNVISARIPRGDAPAPSAQTPATQPAAPITASNPPANIGNILRASCGPDSQRLCAGVRREIDVLKCLGSRRAELSSVCSSYFQKLGERPTVQRDIPSKKPQSVTPSGKPSGGDKAIDAPG